MKKLLASIATALFASLMVTAQNKIDITANGSNSWSYTPLGRIDGAGAAEIRNFLSGSSVDVSLSVSDQAGVDDVTADVDREPEVYTLQGHRLNLGGRKISDLPKGIYIINGKKQHIK